MKPEDQRLAIGEAVGWKRHTDKEHQYSGSHLVVEGWIRQKPGTTGLNTFDFEWRDSWNLPDYLNDLNAMHAAEQTLDLKSQSVFGDILAVMMGHDDDPYEGWRVGPIHFFEFAHATAAQRAEAFLKCIGKWTD